MLASERSPELAEALGGPNAPIVVFDKVSLSFDDKAILREVQLHADHRAHEDLSRRQRRGQVDDPEVDPGVTQAGQRGDLGERRASGYDERVRPDEGACRPGHGVPGGRALRLVDRGRERRLQALRRERYAARRRPTTRRGGPRIHRADASTSTRCRRNCQAASGGASRSRARCRYKPRILLYDEPTTGLDPITADTIDDEIIKLRDLENVSSIVVTHQLRDAFRIATHEAVREDDAHQNHPR